MEIHIITRRDVERCPKRSLSASHYRDDGTCRCDERAEAQADVVRLRDALAAARLRYRNA